MTLWSLVAAGNADPGAADDLRRNLDGLLADPRYGTGVNMLHVDHPPSARALHICRDGCACQASA